MTPLSPDPKTWPAHLREELEERIAIMMDGNHWSEQRATLEATKHILERQLRTQEVDE